MIEREALIVSGARDENEFQGPAGGERGEAAECKQQGGDCRDNESKRDGDGRDRKSESKEPRSIGVKDFKRAGRCAHIPQAG